MKKEEILEKSRNENKGLDQVELSVIASAGRLASQIGMLICCIVAVLQVIFTNTICFESWMIYFSILGTTFTFKYIKLKLRHELFIAILFDLLFVLFTVLFILRIIG